MTERLEYELSYLQYNEQSSLILQPFRHFTYATAYSPTFPSLYLRHSSFSNPSAALPTSQFILQPFFRFSYVTSSSLNSPGEQAELILQPFRHFTYATAYSPTLPSLYLRHSSFFNHSVPSPTAQLILQPFFRFSYAIGSSLMSPGELPMVPRETSHVHAKMSWNVQTVFFNISKLY